MTRVVWSEPSEKKFELGVDRGVLYVDEGTGVPWNGLVSVDEAPSGGDAKPYYMDGVKYLNRPMREEFEATINAFMSPQQFDECDGSRPFLPGVFVQQQRRKEFGLTYRTKVGNSAEGEDFGYKIHIIYNALAAPSQRSYNTVSEDPEAMILSWGLKTRPIPFPGMAPSSHLVIDTTEASEAGVTALEDILYGDETHAPRLPMPVEIAELFVENYEFEVIDNGDGTFTVNGPPDSIELLDSGLYMITRDTIIDLGNNEFEIGD